MIELETIKIGALIAPLVALLVGAGQIGVVVWGIAQMAKASEARNRQLDDMSKALEEMGSGIRALLERQVK